MRRRLLAVPRRDGILVTGAVAILIASWPVFVFTGAQPAYLVGTAGSCLAAAGLVRLRTPLAAGFLIAVLALVGSDVNGQLGKGNPILGSLRILDITLAAAAVTAAWVDRANARRLLARPGTLSILGAVATAYVGLRWLTAGHRVDAFLRTDLRLLVVAAMTSFVSRRCRRGPADAIGWSIVVAGALAAIKAWAVYGSGLFAIGSNDRVQATSMYTNGHVRTILAGGGDTLLILVPGVAILLASGPLRPVHRALLATAGLGSLAALGLSSTRTSLLVSFGLAVLAAGSIFAERRLTLRRSTVVVAVAIGLLAAGIATLGQAPRRLLEEDAPHTGLGFRRDEVTTFFKLPVSDQLLGQGLGGRLRTTDTFGNPVLSGWMHELPFWIALKAGIIGLLLAALAYVVVLRRGLRALRRGGGRSVVLSGQLLILGLLIMSTTINRLGLVEGALLLPIAVLLAEGTPDAATEPAARPAA